MPNQHKAPMLGWHPPADLSAWARDEAKRRGVPLKVILDEALAEKRAAERPPRRIPLPADNCAHPKSMRDPKNPSRCRCGALNLEEPR